MKKHFIIPLLLLLSVFGCQKNDKNQNISNQKSNLSNKQITYVRTDTVSYHAKLLSQNTPNGNNHTDVTQIPLMSLGITYEGNGLYSFQPLNNQTGDNYDCGYAIFKGSSSNNVLYKDLGRNNGYELAQPYTSTIAPGNYFIEVYYYSGPMSGGPDPTEHLAFTIYNEPTAPSGMICLFRYFNSTSGQHICTSNWEELGSYSEGFHFEKTIGYMYPTSTTGSNLEPLYRYYDSSTGSHYLTSIYGNISGYVLEGTLGQIGITASGNLVNPLDKWYDAAIYDHYNCVPPQVPNNSAYTKDAFFLAITSNIISCFFKYCPPIICIQVPGMAAKRQYPFVERHSSFRTKLY